METLCSVSLLEFCQFQFPSLSYPSNFTIYDFLWIHYAISGQENAVDRDVYKLA
jgi:hypothetical protein